MPFWAAFVVALGVLDIANKYYCSVKNQTKPNSPRRFLGKRFLWEAAESSFLLFVVLF